MHRKLVLFAALSTLGWQSAIAQETQSTTSQAADAAAEESQAEGLVNPGVRNLERRIEYLEKLLEEQRGEPLEEAQQEAEQLTEPADGPTLEIGGVVEIDATHTDPDEGESESDLTLSTLELLFGSQLNENFRADIGLFYEEGEDTELEVDSAFVSYSNNSQSFGAVGGLFYVPFGNYTTGLLSDPLTLTLGETQDTAAMVNFALGPVSSSLYAFEGESEVDDGINVWGVDFNTEVETGAGATTLQAGYISNITESWGLLDGVGGVADAVPGLALAVVSAFGPVVLIAEYVAATDAYAVDELEFEGAGAEPSAWNLEFNYVAIIANKAANFAVAYQGSDEASGVLPENKALLGMTVNLNEWVAFGIEYAMAEDYDGSEENVFTARLSAAFSTHP